MSSIKVTLKNGEIVDFPHRGRSGGSYSKQLKLEPGFVIVEDEWGERTIFPSEDVAQVKETPTLRGGF